MDNIFQEVAKKNHTSEAEVRKEIEAAIRMAMADPDPRAKDLWKTVPRKGKEPTPEEFLAWLIKTVHTKNE